MSSMRPRVSVVIPAYNRADVIGRAISSVLSQTEEDLEVVVVDDGSTDATRAVVGSFDDERIEYLSIEHQGAAAARNAGANRARAKWLTFLDSDDTVVPDWLASLFAETCVPDTALVSCGYTERVDGNDAVLRLRLPRRASPSVGPIVELISTGGSYMLLRDVFITVGGFDPRQTAAQHQELALRLGPLLVQRGMRCAAVNRSLVDRWVGRDDHIRGNDQAVFDGSVRLLDVHRERLALDRPLMANTAATAAFRAVRLGRFADARRLMWFAVRTQPRNLRHWARLAALIVPKTAQRYATRSHPTATASAG
jgi:glycosyltransferase involved in cell wall biosynthesis